MTAWDEVGDRCFRRWYKAWSLNVGVVCGNGALLVVDTRANLREADELLDDLKHFGRPVKWVVNSHWHFDHTFGNQRFVEEAQSPSGSVANDLELWAQADMPVKLARNQDPDFRQLLRRYIGEDAADEFDREFDRVVLTPPDRHVVDRHILDLGDRNVELAHPGKGHTGSDLVILVEDAGVIYAGDLLEESGPPHYGGDSYPLEWPETTESVIRMGASTFVPGHGDVMSRSAAESQSREIQTVASLIRELHAAGVAEDKALGEGGGRWPYPQQTLGPAVRRGYEALT